jgi:hypothetical protein
MRLVSLLVALANQVPEAPAADAVVWDAPPVCPQRRELDDAIARRLGRPLGDREVGLAGRITRHDRAPRYRLNLRLTAGGRSEARTLTAERCASLVDATALLVALAAGHTDAAPLPVDVADEAPAPEPVDVADAAPEPVVTESAPPPSPIPIMPPALDPDPPAPPAVPPPTRRPGGVVRLHGGPELGAVPGVTGALGLAGGLLWRRARLEFHALWLAPRTRTRDDTSLRVTLLAGGVQACARPGGARLEVPLCGGLELGGMRGAAHGPDARSVTAFWLAGVAAAGLAWHANARLTLSLAVQGVVRIAGPRFELLRDPGRVDELFEPVASGRLLAGLELRFGDPR